LLCLKVWVCFSFSWCITSSKSSFRTVNFLFSVYHGIKELLSYRHFPFLGVSRHQRAPIVPSISFFRCITSSKSPYRTVTFPFSVYHGIKEFLSYRQFPFLGISRHQRAPIVPSFSLSRCITSSKSSFRTVNFLFSVYHVIKEVFSYRHFPFLGVTRHQRAPIVPSFSHSRCSVRRRCHKLSLSSSSRFRISSQNDKICIELYNIIIRKMESSINDNKS
jgi:hypothetical protein